MDPFIQRGARANAKRSSWHGTAFIVEAIVLLAFIVGAIALFMQLFSGAAVKGAENEGLAHALVLASNSAERFAADPAGAAGETDENGYTVACEVTPEETAGGTLYHAEITVLDGDTELYRLETARYVSEVAQ